MVNKGQKTIFYGSIAMMLLLFAACGSKSNSSGTAKLMAGDTLETRYAKGFQVIYKQNNKSIVVKNPWQHARNIKYNYQLSSDAETATTINTPVKRVVCLSTTHIGFIDALGKTGSIVGLSNPGFVSNKKVRKAIENEQIVDVGNDQALNYEVILNLKPDLVFAYSVGAEVSAMQQKLESWGIPVIVVAEYLENTPLAKAEWIKFFAAFYNMENTADSIFSDIETKYSALTLLTKNVNHKPKVMTSLPWKDVWYIPGGNSFMAHFIQDAGGDYLWKENTMRESQALAIEHVFHKGQEADIWVNVGLLNSLKEIKQADSRLALLNAYKNKEVYNNNNVMSPKGGNDFYESGVVHPEIILKDLIGVFHPELTDSLSFIYYKKLQ